MTKLEITVCMGSSCFARGNDQNLEFIENYIKENGLEADIDFSGARCAGECAQGPNITVNGQTYHGVDIEKIKEILDSVTSQ